MEVSMKLRYLFVLILVALLLSSCGPTESSTGDSPITITDSTGHSVTLESLPQRVVVAGKATIMVQDAVYLFAEANERIVGIENRRQSAYSFLPFIDPALEDKSILEINAGPEQIAALQPDLVILKSFMIDQLGAPLESLGIPVLYVDLENPEAFYQDVATLGGVFGDNDRADEIIDFYQSRAEEITQAVSDLTDANKPEVLVLEYSDKGGEVAFNVPPTTWLQTSMVEMAGGTPVWVDDAEGGGWMIVTIEQIAAWDPDKIFVIDYSGNASTVVEGLKTDSLWMSLSAVQNDQLYAFAYDIYSWDQPDTRWILGLQWLATKIQPELFSDIDILSEVESFYSLLYGMDSESIESDIFPLLTGDIP
jgi:iron complex transport system substrate-binding protein